MFERGTTRRFVASGATYLNTDRSSEYIPVHASRNGPSVEREDGILVVAGVVVGRALASQDGKVRVAAEGLVELAERRPAPSRPPCHSSSSHRAATSVSALPWMRPASR